MLELLYCLASHKQRSISLPCPMQQPQSLGEPRVAAGDRRFADLSGHHAETAAVP
jgi:hypothetical protein